MPNEVWAVGAQWGLVGIMILAIFAGIAWTGKRMLSKDGILENQAKSMQSVSQSLDGVTRCLDKHVGETTGHMTACQATGKQVDVLHRAAMSALLEIEDECRHRGLDITARVQRVRQVLMDG